MSDRPYLFYELTNSLCGTCLRKVEAKVVSAGQQVAVPLAVFAATVFLLATGGCVFIPTADHQQMTVGHRQRKSFLPLVGSEIGPVKLTPRLATRADVEAALGPPQRASADGLSVLYTMNTWKDAWVYPLFIQADPVYIGVRGLRISYDQRGATLRCEISGSSDYQGPMDALFRYSELSDRGLIDAFDSETVATSPATDNRASAADRLK